MSENFAKKWEPKREEESLSSAIRNTITPPPPLKTALDLAVRKLDLQISKLDQANERFTEKDKSYSLN